MPYVRFQTADLAIVRRKLAAAVELHGDMADSVGRKIALSVLPATSIGCLDTTDGEEIWCSGAAERVLRVGRKYVRLLDARLDPAKQLEPPRWIIDIVAVES